MFDLSALIILTIFNLLALVQIAASILLPVKLQRGPILGAAAICLATSVTGLVMAVLVPSPVVGIASLTIAALVNLCAFLGTGLDRLSDLSLAAAIRARRGLVRLAILGTPHQPALADASLSSQRIASTSAPSTVRRAAPAPVARATPNPLPSLLEAASRLALPVPTATRPTRNELRTPASAQPLAPRQHAIIPRRPHRLPTSSLAFLLSVPPTNQPAIFADARAGRSDLSALARRVRLVATDPCRPILTPQSTSVWPTTFSEPDPAWRTSYGRLPAIAAGA